jgi:hypothetical protein
VDDVHNTISDKMDAVHIERIVMRDDERGPTLASVARRIDCQRYTC